LLFFFAFAGATQVGESNPHPFFSHFVRVATPPLLEDGPVCEDQLQGLGSELGPPREGRQGAEEGRGGISICDSEHGGFELVCGISICDSEHGGFELVGCDHGYSEHSGTDHADSEHGGTEHSGTDHADSEHGGTEHSGSEHGGTDHADSEHGGSLWHRQSGSDHDGSERDGFE
jgi:hypothetical protein